MFNPDLIRSQFPIFSRKINGQPLVYLDSAATAQKPQVVIDAIADYYSQHNANVHRGLHTLGDESTQAYHEARETVAKFIGVNSQEIVFTSNTTEALNLVALSFARPQIKPGQVILVSELEHHSNLVVWQEVAKQTGAKLDLVKITEDGQIRLDHLESLVERYGKDLFLVSLSHISNVTGAVLELSEVCRIVKTNSDAYIVIDAAQSVPHLKIDMSQTQVDFLAFSGHKLYGPMGIGVLASRTEHLKKLKPLYFGGGMIDDVFYQNATFAKSPDRFDAGTPNVSGAVGLATAIDFLEEIGMDQVEAHSRELTEVALSNLSNLGYLRIIGPVSSQDRLGSVAFVYQKGHAHDIAQILNSQGIAVRSGHHCTMPLHEKMGWGSSVRASFGVYNTKADIEALLRGLEKVGEIIT